MGLLISKTSANLLLFSFFSHKRIPFDSEQFEIMVSRTGRLFQRYNSKGYRQVVGCIPYRYRKTNQSSSFEDIEVLVVSSQKSQAMMFPKGGWEMDECKEVAARRETLEEAGVDGKVQKMLGKWNYKSKRHGKMHEGYMFPLLVTKQLDIWPEKNLRERRWMSVKEAREVCQQGWMKEALDRLVSRQSTIAT
ncbi:nudix hydrolase 18, mitochondrial-like [Juglans microcarpa x Juglans regia]|uniref:nudix hydrolase 18, mitochondrial-like n=1 Tax=Juglans microcarpa x Juglans regia TaxID=2249226 RepID=UPI001B7EE8B7|nr:nudix hydrolase 18, mitochondrial-like [Juglans microcarpa x Juglans regia]